MKTKIISLSFLFLFLFTTGASALQTYDYVSIKNKEYPPGGESVILEAITPTQTKTGSFTYIYFNHGSTQNFGSTTVPVLVSSLATTSSTLSSYKLEIGGITPGQYYYARAARFVASTTNGTIGKYAVSGTESIFLQPKKTAPVMKGVSSRSGLCTLEDCELTVYENSSVPYDLGTVNATVSSYFYQTKDFKFDSGNTDNIFSIDYGGKIRVAKSGSLDVDQKDEFKLVVRVFDSSNSSLYATRKVTIKVLPKESNLGGSGVVLNPYTPGGYNSTSTYQGGGNVNYYDPVIPGGYSSATRPGSSYESYPAFKNEPGGYEVLKDRKYYTTASYHTITPGGYGFSPGGSIGVLNLAGKTREEAIREISKKLFELQIEYLRVKALEDQSKSNSSY